MKKYKLIKEYPGSPKIKTEINFSETHTHYNYNGGSPSTAICIYSVENYPEFWQEIVEKEYKILCYSQATNRYSHSVIKRDDSWDIHSVKRLSDEVIFSIGDRIKGYTADKEPFIIQKITIGGKNDNKDYIVLHNSEIEYPFSRTTFLTNSTNGNHQAIKVQNPIFITEDGVEIFERSQTVVGLKRNTLERIHGNGDTIGVWLNGWYTTEWLRNPSESDTKVRDLIREHFIIFSTKEKAERHIIIHKPCLSLYEVSTIKPAFNMKKLEELVKSKL